MNAGPYVLIQYYNNMSSHYSYNVLTRSNVVLLSMKYFREPCCLTYYIGLQDLASCNKVFDSRALFTCLWPSLNWGIVLLSLCLQLDHYIHIGYNKYTIIHNKDLLNEFRLKFNHENRVSKSPNLVQFHYFSLKLIVK